MNNRTQRVKKKEAALANREKERGIDQNQF